MTGAAFETDLLVIGAGACGLAAAISGHDAGLSVAIVEKLDRPGGNSSLSTGSIPGAGSKYQRDAGIEDAPEHMIADLFAVSGHHDADPLLRRMAEYIWPLVRVADRRSRRADGVDHRLHACGPHGA